jgi:conserved oligomeric Golgi complex subunit 3
MLRLKDNDHPTAAHANTLINLSEEPSSIKSPPTATVARRAKSYSDFYRVVKAQLAKESKQIKEREQFLFHPTAAVNYGLNFESMYDTYEDELLDSSQEGFQYASFNQATVVV